MAVAFYMDVHVSWSITDQLRRRGADVLTAHEDEADQWSDEAILRRATELGRVVFTQDIRFRHLAEQWQRQGQHFSGLLFGHQLHGTVGQYVKDLELIDRASAPDEWRDRVGHLPF